MVANHGLLLHLPVPCFVSIVAMPGLCCFLRVPLAYVSCMHVSHARIWLTGIWCVRYGEMLDFNYL